MRSQKTPGATSMALPVGGSCSAMGYCKGVPSTRALGAGITRSVGKVDMRQGLWVSIRAFDVNVNVKDEFSL